MFLLSGQNHEKSSRSVFLTSWRYILSAELTKTHSSPDCFFGDFAHWVTRQKLTRYWLTRPLLEAVFKTFYQLSNILTPVFYDPYKKYAVWYFW